MILNQAICRITHRWLLFGANLSSTLSWYQPIPERNRSRWIPLLEITTGRCDNKAHSLLSILTFQKEAADIYLPSKSKRREIASLILVCYLLCMRVHCLYRLGDSITHAWTSRLALFNALVGRRKDPHGYYTAEPRSLSQVVRNMHVGKVEGAIETMGERGQGKMRGRSRYQAGDTLPERWTSILKRRWSHGGVSFSFLFP